MRAKSLASLVVLMALAVASSPARAAGDRTEGNDASGSSAKPPKVQSSHHKPTKKKDPKDQLVTPVAALTAPNPAPRHSQREGATPRRGRMVDPSLKIEERVSVHGGRKSLPGVRTHSAEPAHTPAVAVSMPEPMVFRTDPKVERRSPAEPSTAGAPKPTVDRADDIGDAPKPARLRGAGHSAEPVKSPVDRRLLTRSHAADPANVSAHEADTPSPPSPRGAAHRGTKAPCLHDVVVFERGQEADKFALSKCDGAAAPLAVERLSVLVRPESARRPSEPFSSLAKVAGLDLSPGVRKIDPGLLGRLQQVVDHFGKHGVPTHVSVISGYRPASTGSYHATGQALDLRVEGASNDALVAFCKTLPDTGCGYYPNSSFVHIDVRAPNTGHVYWIDTSGPGETPRYVSTWPPPPESPPLQDMREATAKIISKLDQALPPLPADMHPADAEEEAPAASMATPLATPPEHPRAKPAASATKPSSRSVAQPADDGAADDQ